MQTTTLSFANMHNHGELFANMLRARRELFIVHNKWNLPEAMGMEYDQYDTPASRWVVVHDEDRQGAGRQPSDAHDAWLRHLHLHDPRCATGASGDHPGQSAARRGSCSGRTSGKVRGCSSATTFRPPCRRRVHTQLIMQLGDTVRSLGATHCSDAACRRLGPAGRTGLG